MGRMAVGKLCFSLDEDRIGELPEQLVRQASSIAQKVIRELIHKS